MIVYTVETIGGQITGYEVNKENLPKFLEKPVKEGFKKYGFCMWKTPEYECIIYPTLQAAQHAIQWTIIMETRNDISNLLAMYIRNTREIYDITTWLQNCIIKKASKGIQPSIEHLANCSTMKNIIREAAKLLYKYDGITPTRQEKQQAAKEHAKYILDGVQYSIQKRQ